MRRPCSILILAFMLCITMGAEGVFAGEGVPAAAQSQPQYEFWTGAEAFEHDWSVYSGVTASPFGGTQEDGLRLRAVLGYSSYTYVPGSLKFHGNVGFGDFLLGYHQQFGPVTLKLFGGLSVAGRKSDDPFSSIDGRGWGGKAVAEVGKKHVDLSIMCRGWSMSAIRFARFQLVEPQLRIGDDEYIAGCAVFVNQNTSIGTFFRLHLFQNALAFKHRGQDVASICRRILRSDQTAKELFCIFPRQRFGRLRWQRLVARFPE